MKRAEDLRRVTHLFPTFLGLRLVPVGLWFVVFVLAERLTGPVPTALHVVLAALAAAAIWPIHRWYRRELGVVEPERLGMGRNRVILLGLALAVLAFGLGAQRLGGTTAQVVLLVVILFATAVLYAQPRAFGGGLTGIALIIAAAVLGIPPLLAAGRDPASFNNLGALFALTVGVTLCAAGVLEHHLLKRQLGRLAESGDG